MGKHTPGPWHVEDTNSAGLSLVAVSDVPGANGSTCVVGQIAGPDRVANGRLIAAAPDLLEALELMLEPYGGTPAEAPYFTPKAAKTIASARAAIAKATA